MFLSLQLFTIGLLIAQVALVIAAIIHVRHQLLSQRELLVWDLVILFIPIGWILAFLYFPRRQR